MRICILACAAVVATFPASAQEGRPTIELLSGHPIYHESEQAAGVAMALAITPDHVPASHLPGLCDDLRRAAGLDKQNEDGFRLETIFVVPYKAMAIEGYYWPEGGGSGGVLVRGDDVARTKLDAILTDAGIPPDVLDETAIEHEISCGIAEPQWHLVWHDIRPIGDEAPRTVIDRAHDRFMAIHQAVVEHTPRTRGSDTSNARLPMAERR